MSPEDQPIKTGDVLDGRYRVERLIGKGGMGLVLAARHAGLGHRVAVKILAPGEARDPARAARFMREARAAATLTSEHTVRVLDVGIHRGLPFFVMELLEGEDLGRVVERAPLPIVEAVDAILQACDAVAEAHAAGIVHRDLKPANLFRLRTKQGRMRIKVLDFGLAMQGGGAAERLTGTMEVMGSPHYMSPEQMRSLRDVDARTDQWSLGVCLYELLSSAVPFEAETMPVVCTMVLTQPPAPLRPRRPDVPEGLLLVIERCLEKDSASRFADIAELARALEPFGSPDARGTGERLAGVLRAGAITRSVPPLLDEAKREGGDTRTVAIYDLVPQVPRAWLRVALGFFAILVAAGLALSVLAVMRSRRTVAVAAAREPRAFEPGGGASSIDTVPRARAVIAASSRPAESSVPTQAKAPPSAAPRRPSRPRDPSARF